MAQRALVSDDERTAALRTIVGDMLAFDESRKFIAATISGLDIQ